MDTVKYTYEDMMDIAGWMAAADNKRPVPELKEEAEVYIKNLDAKKEPGANWQSQSGGDAVWDEVISQLPVNGGGVQTDQDQKDRYNSLMTRFNEISQGKTASDAITEFVRELAKK